MCVIFEIKTKKEFKEKIEKYLSHQFDKQQQQL